MDNINLLIAMNLKRIRKERKLSLENVAKLTGVSKSMIGQIERGEVNPSISTIWKMSTGFKISFTELMSKPESEIELVERSETRLLLEDNGKFRDYPIFCFDSIRRFEMHTVEIQAGSRLVRKPHPLGTQEFITVFNGEVTIEVNGESYRILENNAIRFKADTPHSYINSSNEMCKMSIVIYYPQ